MKPSLGHRLHYDAHLRRRRLDVSPDNYELPDIHGRDYSQGAGGVTSHRSQINPPAEWVNAIDARAGRAGWQQHDLEGELQLQQALQVLNAYDPVMHDVVHIVCITGRWAFKRGHQIVHYDWEPAARLIDSGVDRPDQNDRKVWDWLTEAWIMLALLVSGPDRHSGESRNPGAGKGIRLPDLDPATRRAYDKLKKRGLLE